MVKQSRESEKKESNERGRSGDKKKIIVGKKIIEKKRELVGELREGWKEDRNKEKRRREKWRKEKDREEKIREEKEREEKMRNMLRKIQNLTNVKAFSCGHSERIF